MEIGSLIIFIALLIFAAHFFSWTFSHTKIPDALLLMCVGLLVGPILGLIPPDLLGDATQLGVMLVLVIVLFEGGLDLRYATIKQAWRGTVGLALSSYFITAALTTLILWSLFSFSGVTALLVGSIIGGTSSVVILPLLDQIKMQDAGRATLTLESVFSDVLAIVITIALLEAWYSGGVSFLKIISHIFISFTGAAFLGIITAFIWARLLNLIRPMQNSVFTTPAALLLLFGVTDQLGFSGPIAALSFGIVMGNMAWLNTYLERNHPFIRYTLWSTALNNKERLFFSEAAFLLETFFFVYVGMSMQVQGIKTLFIGLFVSIIIMLIRPVIVRLVVSKETLVHDATIMSVMIPRGMAAAALATLPLQLGIQKGETILGIVYAVILFSVLLTSLLIFSVHRTTVRQHYAAFLKKFT